MKPDVSCSEDDDLLTVGTHDTGMARELASAEQGFTVTTSPEQAWICTGHDSIGNWYRFTEATARGALPVCPWIRPVRSQ